MRTLHPSYFALVMATCIISVNLHQLGLLPLSLLLLWIAAASYVVLIVLSLWRLVSYPAVMAEDLRDPQRGFGFFTFVAGTNVLGTRLLLDGHELAAIALLVLGGLAWIGLGYGVPAAVLAGHRDKPAVEGANGTWFIGVVAAQSVAVLAATLEPLAPSWMDGLALLAVFAWSVGGCLYAAMASIVVIRLMIHPPRPEEVAPPYWVAMGATAITVVGGTRIVEMTGSPGAGELVGTRIAGFVVGVAVVFWAFGTCLIPALLVAGWWRHVTRRVPLRYEPGWWSIVFPLGMYAASAHDLGLVTGFPFLSAIATVVTWPAFLVWVVVFVAMLVRLGRGFRPPRRTSEPA
ncbi:tellurite resistance/C4-dicarboxylate transporter family protein [Actinopolymorpha alba]|uniref:tellurite resistance/C4-dicarboxylate transporter family protein n=1 Tax=Actinopolymorpha alba TaxID=533267 RepID=UPI000377006A|nr:tellurite resistance/C4-dicarboxylate transporter family protein [Actinopolymorpha alba]